MSLWKSPVLYVGLLIVLLVGGALAAPFIIDWNGYRDKLQAYGQALSGRAVAINGPIAVRLFPWPRLEASDVSLANPRGFESVPMLQAGKITVHLALASLVSGQIRVEQIDLEKPLMNLALNAKGDGNWHLAPEKALMATGLLNNVLLDEIHVSDGALRLRDERHGFSRDLSKINGVVSAAAIEGPWRMKGTGHANDLPLDISYSSPVVKKGQPFQFAFKLAPQDGALPALSFEGQGEGGKYTGKLVLDPVETSDGRTSLAGALKPLAYQAKIEVEGDRAILSAIHIVAADTKDTGTLIEGDASLDLSRATKLDLHLTSPHIDMDKLAGEQAMRVWQAGGLLGLANKLIGIFPDNLDLNTTLEVNALTAAGQNMENVQLKASAAGGAIRIQDLTADLPGRSRMKFNGIVFPAQAAAELGGSMAFETSDARAFTEWLWPEGKETVNRLWTGARGRLKVQSDVTWGGQRFGFQNLQYELDGLLGKGDVAVTQGQIPAVHLQLSADKFDLGSYVSGGLSALATQQELLSLLPSRNGLEKSLALDFGTLTINGVDAQKVSVNVNSNASGFEVKSFDIGAVEGAEVKGNGLVLMSPEGPSGDIKFVFGAARPQGLMRLLGLLPLGAEPKWAQGFGRTDMRADLDIKPGAKEPQVNYSITGTSGPYKLVSSGTLQDFSLSQGAVVGLSGTASSADARDILRLLGFESKGTGGGDGQISLTGSGNAAQGYKTAIDIQGLGATAGFAGLYRPQNGRLGFDGTFALNAEHDDGVFTALGFPLGASGNGPLALKADTISSVDGLKIKAVTLQAGEQNLKGSGQLIRDGALKLDLSGGTLRMIDAVAFAAAPWTGAGSFPNGSFEGGWPFGLSGELWLRPQSFTDFQGLPLTEPVIGISSDKDGRSLSVIGRAAGDGKMQIDGSLKAKGSSYALAGTVHYPLQLAQVFKGDSKEFGLRGSATLDGTFAGEGRSALSLLNTISGVGKVDVSAGQLVGLAPDPFYAAIKDAKSNAEIQKAFADLTTGPGLATQPAELEFKAKDGTITFKPLALESEQSRLSILPTVDLPNGNVATTVTMSSKAQIDLPDMRVIYEGMPGAMRSRVDAAALASKLGTELINKDMAELDRIALEQKKAEGDAAVQAQADKDKFDAFQAQRMELRLQQRMIKVFAQQRTIDAARAKASLDAALNYGLSIMKDEKHRLMQLVPVK